MADIASFWCRIEAVRRSHHLVVERGALEIPLGYEMLQRNGRSVRHRRNQQRRPANRNLLRASLVRLRMGRDSPKSARTTGGTSAHERHPSAEVIDQLLIFL
jgi:hypothetical protein